MGGTTAVALDTKEASIRDRTLIIPLVLGRDPRDPDAAAALDRRAAAADRHGRALVRRGTRRLGARVRRRLRLPRRRPGGAAVRVRVPRRARRRLQHLPDDAGARGERAARHPCGRAARARGHRRGHHVGRARARRDVRGARRAADPLPRADLVHRRVRGAARHVPRAIAARAGARVRPRSRDLVAVEALARTAFANRGSNRSPRRPTPWRPMRRASRRRGTRSPCTAPDATKEGGCHVASALFACSGLAATA